MVLHLPARDQTFLAQIARRVSDFTINDLGYLIGPRNQ